MLTLKFFVLILEYMETVETIYSYLDYRLYLKDWYTAQLSSKKTLSYRAIAAYVGFNSPAHITMVLKGKANLSLERVARFAQLLKLKKREKAYFELLVSFNQEKKTGEKKILLDSLINFKKDVTTLLVADQYEYYQKWYYAVVHDILSYCKFDGDYDKLAKMVEPQITTREARKAVKLLEKLRFITRRCDGGYDCQFTGISAYSEGHELVLSSYAEKMIERAKYALDNLPSEERVISWAGFSVSADTFLKIKEETRAFRKKIVSLAQNDQRPDRAFHMNIQIFPVSKPETPKDSRSEK